jgi:hypothetical protein
MKKTTITASAKAPPRRRFCVICNSAVKSDYYLIYKANLCYKCTDRLEALLHKIMTSINNNIVNTTTTTTTAASSVTAADVEKEEVNEGGATATATAKTEITYSDFEDPPQGNDHNDDDDDDEEEELEEMMMTATDNNNTRCMVFKCKEKAEYSFLGKRAKQKCFCRDHYLLISSIIKGKSSI